jgi:alanine-synthesizing transaminase
MFSTRLDWPPRRNRLAALLAEKRARGARLLDLTESNPTRVGLEIPGDQLAAALADPGVAAYDPDPRGLPEARAAVAAWCARTGPGACGGPRPRQAVSADRMVLTASTSEAYAFLFRLLSDPGDTVLVPAPSYPLFDYLAAIDGVRAAPYPLTLDERWRIDLEALARALAGPAAAVPRAVIVVNPNNPTGSGLTEDERAAIDDLCARAGVALISDEVFLDYLWAGGPADAPANGPAGEAGSVPVSASTPRAGGRVRAGDGTAGTGGAPPRTLTFTLGGLSKSCGLPQMKLGWVLVDGPDDARAGALERLEFIADAYLSVGTPVQRAAGRLLAIGGEIAARIGARVSGNLEALRAAVPPVSPCRVLPADGGWSAVLQVPAVRPEEDLVLDLLREDDVHVHPGYFFDFPREAFLVLSLLPRPEEFRAALDRILTRVGT